VRAGFEYFRREGEPQWSREIFNLIVRQDPQRLCENEACRGPFNYQQGGAEHGQYRSGGVEYCSPECREAQKQRRYRRAKKQAQKAR
jgi:hypothetical protein